MKDLKVDLRSWGPPPTPRHRRVVAGPVIEEVVCLSMQEFEDRVPEASPELRREALGFFMGLPGELVVVPGKSLAPTSVHGS